MIYNLVFLLLILVWHFLDTILHVLMPILLFFIFNDNIFLFQRRFSNDNF